MSNNDNHEENYFVSMTDMMIGMLFIFIIIIMIFAMNFRKSEQDNKINTQKLQKLQQSLKDKNKEIIDLLNNSQETRTKIIQKLQQSLKKKGVIIHIDTRNGILRLPENILFGLGKSVLDNNAKNKLYILAETLMEVIPCYTNFDKSKLNIQCNKDIQYKLDAIFIEGHTDKSGSSAFNLKLSTERAMNAYNHILTTVPLLSELKNSFNKYLFSVSAYGEKRLISNIDAENRRIDLRFLMTSPQLEEFNKIEREINQ